MYMIVGVTEVAVASYLLIRPVESEGPLQLTLLLAFYLALIGIVQLAVGMYVRFGGRGWLFASGIVDLALGVVVYMAYYAAWPAPRFWPAALCVGASLLCRGLVTAAVGLEAHRESGTTVRPT